MPGKPYVYDAFVSLLGGMNGAVAPDLVPEGQAANLVNVACRGGHPGNRPGVSAVPLAFATPTIQSAFTTGLFQGAAHYQNGARSLLFASVSGRLYRLTPQGQRGFYVEDMVPAGDPGNDPDVEMVYFAQAENILVMQDGLSPAFLVKDGQQCHRSNLRKAQVPIGTVMAYGFGRLWVASGNEYRAGDLIGEETDAVVRFRDGTYLAENGSFRLPAKFGPVTAMHFYDQQDTATGQGPLMVFGLNGAESVNVQLPRTAWQTQQIQTEALTGFGARGARSVVNVNGDLFFRAGDGWRSYRQARAEQSVWGQVPVSARVRPYTERELPEQLSFGSAVFFNNRLLATCIPQKAGPRCVHAGVLSLDFDVLSAGIGGAQASPAWDGFWMFPRPVAQLVTGTFGGRQRAFAFSTVVTFDSAGAATAVNGLDEIMEGQRFDDAGTPIVSTLETRAFTCSPSIPSAPFTEKELRWVEVYERDRLGATSIALAYRPDGGAAWHPLAVAAPAETTPTALAFAPDGSAVDAPPLSTVRNRCYAPDTDASGNGADSRIAPRFYDAQVQVKWTGSLRIQKLRLAAETKEDTARAGV